MIAVVAVVFTIGLLAGGYLFWTGRDRRRHGELRLLQLPPTWEPPDPDAAYKADLERDLL